MSNTDPIRPPPLVPADHQQPLMDRTASSPPEGCSQQPTMEEGKDLSATNRGHQGSASTEPSIGVVPPPVGVESQGGNDRGLEGQGQQQQTPLFSPPVVGRQGDEAVMTTAAPARRLQTETPPEVGSMSATSSSCSAVVMSCSSPPSPAAIQTPAATPTPAPPATIQTPAPPAATQTPAPPTATKMAPPSARPAPQGVNQGAAESCFRHPSPDPSVPPEQVTCHRHVTRKRDQQKEEYEATWGLPVGASNMERPSLRAEQVPIEMRESYIWTGYRPPGIGVTVSAYSALYLHNETLNFWTHMIPFLYFAYFLFIDQGPWLRLSLITGLGRYPFYGYMVGICTLFGASSFAHLFHCAGHRRWSNVCFVCDYAAISVYGTASAISYYFYSRPRFRGTFIGYMLSGEGQFLGLTTAAAWVATYASCITRLRPNKYCYAIRTVAFTLPFVTGSFPAIMRWMHAGAVLKGPPAVVEGNTSSGGTSSGNIIEDVIANVTASVVLDTGLYRYPQLDYDFQTPYTRHLLMLSGGALINVLKIPERFWPGRFDNIGSSHQWFHILVFTSIREQFWLMLEEIACHSGMLYARDPDDAMPWGRATIQQGQTDGAPCTIITSTSSTPHLHQGATGHHTMAASTSWFYPWGWSWNSLLFCALGNPRASLDTWMALNTIAWWTILLSTLTITIVWFGYSYNFEFSELECCCPSGAVGDNTEDKSSSDVKIAESSSSPLSSSSSLLSMKNVITTDPSIINKSTERQQGVDLRQRSGTQVSQSQGTG